MPSLLIIIIGTLLFGFLILVIFCYTRKRVKVKYGEIEIPIHLLIAQNLAFLIDFDVLPTASEGKLVFLIHKVIVYKRFDDKRKPKAFYGFLLTAFKPLSYFLSPFLYNIAKLLGNLLCFKVSEAKLMLFPHIRDKIYTETSLIDYLEIDLTEFLFNFQDKILRLNLIMKHKCNVPNVEQPDLSLGISLHRDLRLFIDDNELKLVVTPELLACIGSLVTIDQNQSSVFHFRKVFRLLEGLCLHPVDISLSMSLTTSSPEFRYFDSLNISLIKFNFLIRRDCLECECIFGEFVTFATDSLGAKVSSKAYRMIEEKIRKHRLIYASELKAYIRYINFVEFGSTFGLVKEFIKSVGTSEFNHTSYFLNSKTESTKSSVASTGIGFDVRADFVEFGCAFEYPLTLVFDELTNVVKGAFGIQPKSLNGDLLINYSYTLTVFVNRALFFLADSSFDRNIEALLLRDRERLRSKYTCFKITGQEIRFTVKWDEKLLSGRKFKSFSDLINRMENERFITSDLCRNFATCLGGWTELSAKNLQVVIKDEETHPLVNAPQLSIAGLLFLLELAPYKEAMTKIPLLLSRYPDNLKRINEGRFQASKCITPIKLFHALVGNIFGDEPALITYNLYWTDIFESVSRGFEIFSSPPGDPSPVMSVFDKMPYIFRGCNTCIATSTFTKVVIGFDPKNQECLIAHIPDGIFVSQKGKPSWFVKLGDTSVFFKSKMMNPLIGEMCKLNTLEEEEERIVQIGNLPSFHASLDFETDEKCSHWQVKPVSSDNFIALDAYAEYRTRSIKMKIDFMFESTDNPVRVSYNRYLEDWLASHIMRLVGSKVKTGSLWSSWLIPQLSETQGFSVCLKEIELHFSISCPLEIKFYTLGYDLNDKLWCIMAVLEASHGNFLFVLGRKSYHLGFSIVYSDSDYNEINVSVEVEENSHTKLLLSSDRLAYVIIDEGYFKAKDNFLVIQEHRDRLLKKQHKLKNLKNLPFINKRVEEIEEQIKRIQNSDESALIVRRQFTIYKAYIVWDKSLRNCIFKLIDAQFSYEIGNKARSVSLLGIEKIIHAMEHEKTTEEVAGEDSRIASPRDLAQKLVQDLLTGQKQPFIATPEQSKQADIKSDVASAEDLRDEFGLKIFSKTAIDILDVQVCLETVATFGSRFGEQEAAILSLPKISVVSSLLFNGERKPMFRRSKFELIDAKVSVAYYKFFGEEQWPPFIREENEKYLIPVTNNINIKVTYDSAFNILQKIKLLSEKRKFKLQGSFIQVECPAFELECSNEEYYVIYELIVNLLAYRDPNMARRSQRTSEFVRSSEFKDGHDLLTKVAALKLELYESTDELSIEYKAKKELLCALLEIVHSWRSLKERMQNKQSRLELNVILRKLSWKLALHGSYVAEAKLTELFNQWLSLEDGSMSNLLEVQNITSVNIMPEAFYRTMVVPLKIELLDRLGIDYGGEPLSTANYGSLLRIFFRASFPDVGKVIIEHAEIDLSPLFAQVTQEIIVALFEYFFPPTQSSKAISPEEEKKSEEKALGGVDEPKYFSYVVVPQSRHLISFKVRFFIIIHKICSIPESPQA